MKRKRFSEEQIIGVLKESGAGAKTDDGLGLCHEQRTNERRLRAVPQDNKDEFYDIAFQRKLHRSVE